MRPKIRQARGARTLHRARALPSALAIAAVAWLPTMLLAAREALLTGAWPAVALAFETHVRYLLAVPLFLATDRAVHERMDRCVHELLSGGFLRGDEIARFRAMASRLHRHTESSRRLAYCLLIAAATVAANPLTPGPGAASRWEASVGLTLFRFVLLLPLWRWGAWSLLLVRVSRFRLALVATHPDLAGGLGFLTQPSEAFSTFALATGAFFAGRWSTDVFHHGVPFLSFKRELAVFATLVTFLGILPLFPFTIRLFKLRLRALRDYGAFARDYCERFETRWVRRGGDAQHGDPLGTPDVQALSDLANSFSVVVRTRPFIATPRLVATLALAALLPMIPLFLTVVPLEEIVPRLVRLL